MNRKNEAVRSVVLGTVRRQPLLCTALVLAVAGAVAASLLPPLVLGRVVDRLTARQVVPFALTLGYFGLLALSGGLDSLRESLLTVFGQKMTHALRSAMCAKLDKLPAEAFVNQESGAAVSRFVGDVDTVEELFTSGIIISMTAKQGEQVTLIGRTGAGKSTVFRLLLGLYPAESGTVTIGGVPVADITDRERRTCISCVEQHFARVPGTVLDQITLGDPQITAEMAKHAAQLAGIDGAIEALPDGYDTPCSEGMFSQGEWQLLSIARAAAADPAVLLLDEITANLDAETEARVLEALRRASEGRTVLSVSHRIYENLGGRTVEIKIL